MKQTNAEIQPGPMGTIPAMKPFIIATLAAIGMMLAMSPAHAQATQTQTIQLSAGWNAVYLTVQPDPRTPAAVFASILDRVESVWAWFDGGEAVEFIVDPAEEVWNEPGWHVYFPEETKAAFLTNLHALFANTAYLVKMEADAELVLTGGPSGTHTDWTTDSFNLTGLHVDPENPPTFGQYFAGSAAHAGQPAYRLTEAGKWQKIDAPDETQIQAGRAYWIYCRGASDFQGPIYYSLPMHDGLHYGALLTELKVAVENASDAPRTLSFDFIGADIVLAYRAYNPDTGFYDWVDLQEPRTVVLEPGESRNTFLSVRRERMSPGEFKARIEIRDDQGFRVVVPVTAKKNG